MNTAYGIKAELDGTTRYAMDINSRQDRLAESYRSAEAYTVLSAANMPEARAYFGAMFNPKEARP